MIFDKAEYLHADLICCEEQHETISNESERGIGRRDDGRLVKCSRTVKALDGGFILIAASYCHTLRSMQITGVVIPRQYLSSRLN